MQIRYIDIDLYNSTHCENAAVYMHMYIIILRSQLDPHYNQSLYYGNIWFEPYLLKDKDYLKRVLI